MSTEAQKVDVLAECAARGINIDGFPGDDFGWVSNNDEEWGYASAEDAATAALARVGGAA